MLRLHLSVAPVHKYMLRNGRRSLRPVSRMLATATPPPQALSGQQRSPGWSVALSDSPLHRRFSCRPPTHRLGSRDCLLVSYCLGPPDWLNTIRHFSRRKDTPVDETSLYHHGARPLGRSERLQPLLRCRRRVLQRSIWKKYESDAPHGDCYSVVQEWIAMVNAVSSLAFFWIDVR